MRFVSESRSDETAQRALRTGATLEFPAYLFVLSLGPAVFALATNSLWMLGLTAFLILIAWKTHQSFAAVRKSATVLGARRTWIAEDGIFLDGILGPAKWEWDAVDDVRVAGSHVIIQFASREAMVMPVEGAEAERLVSFIRERSERRLADNPGRLLFLLAILYATSVAAAVILLH